MPNHIHTIPVLDALREPGHCAFCVMFNKLERDAVNFIMGPAYMEDNVRMETNRTGFCKRHMEAMYGNQNRLGLALLLHTYTQQLNKDAKGIIASHKPAPLFGKDTNSVISRLKGHLEKTHGTCYVCRKIESTFERYIDTFFHIWGKGGEDGKLVSSQKGYCLPHFIRLLAAAEGLGRGKREKFLDEILPAWKNIMEELENDLDWFVQKFDFRNADAPWKNSKEALTRAISLLGSDT
ncbi:MAG: DUF6062 family protein [Defluviitaleaceae bacterium]|nr:DUF6062 family protein [Defluviitaleaceae bacterium]